MHALQGLPLLAAALTLLPRLHDVVRVRILRAAAAAWAGLVLLLTWQALRAQPVLAPDALTVTAAAVLVPAAAVAAVVTLARRTDGPAVADA
jgi:hypothetical protein